MSEMKLIDRNRQMKAFTVQIKTVNKNSFWYHLHTEVDKRQVTITITSYK